MSHVVRFRPEAEIHLADALSWYEEQRAGLGDEFLNHVTKALERLQDHPLFYPIIYRNTHRTLVTRFPYLIIYQVEAEEITIIAVLHTRKKPKRW